MKPLPVDLGILNEAVAAQQQLLVEHLRALVEIESPSDNPAAVNRANDLVAEIAAGIGGRVKRHRQEEFGDIIELRFGSARSKE